MKPTRVLLADDHEIVRKGLRSLIDGRPEFEIVGEAINGRDAIEQATRLKPDIVILDLSMPEISGLEATSQILKNVPQTEILVLTIHDSENMATAALQAGARGYVLKSDAGRELLNALNCPAGAQDGLHRKGRRADHEGSAERRAIQRDGGLGKGALYDPLPPLGGCPPQRGTVTQPSGFFDH
jgi:DNA-binding NarL/FixJ family response regulator